LSDDDQPASQPAVCSIVVNAKLDAVVAAPSMVPRINTVCASSSRHTCVKA